MLSATAPSSSCIADRVSQFSARSTNSSMGNGPPRTSCRSRPTPVAGSSGYAAHCCTWPQDELENHLAWHQCLRFRRTQGEPARIRVLREQSGGQVLCDAPDGAWTVTSLFPEVNKTLLQPSRWKSLKRDRFRIQRDRSHPGSARGKFRDTTQRDSFTVSHVSGCKNADFASMKRKGNWHEQLPM